MDVDALEKELTLTAAIARFEEMRLRDFVGRRDR